MQGTYSVYKHTAPNGKVYIGITSQNVEKRFRNGHGYSGNVYFKNSIDKYGWDNFSHEILFHGLSADEAYQKERELIAYYRSNEREYGFNLTDGGESRFHPVESSIQKMRDAKKGMYVGEKFIYLLIQSVETYNVEILKLNKTNIEEHEIIFRDNWTNYYLFDKKY